MVRFLTCFIAVVALVGCSRQYKEFIKYQDDGTAKPMVALLPLVDKANHPLPWSVSGEITGGVRDIIKRKGDLYVLPVESTARLSASTPSEVAEIGTGLDAQFVVTMELMHQTKAPTWDAVKHTTPQFAGEPVLQLMVRLQIYDIRGVEPKRVLQQVLHSSHQIRLTKPNPVYLEKPWGTHGYKKTSIGLAHQRLEQELAQQIDHYVRFVVLRGSN